MPLLAVTVLIFALLPMLMLIVAALIIMGQEYGWKAPAAVLLVNAWVIAGVVWAVSLV